MFIILQFTFSYLRQWHVAFLHRHIFSLCFPTTTILQFTFSYLRQWHVAFLHRHLQSVFSNYHNFTIYFLILAAMARCISASSSSVCVFQLPQFLSPPPILAAIARCNSSSVALAVDLDISNTLCNCSSSFD